MAIQRKNIFAILLLSIIMLFALSPTAFAAKVPVNIPASDASTLSTIISELEKDQKLTVELKSNAPDTLSPGSMIVSTPTGLEFNTDLFEHATDKSRKQVLKNFVDALQSSSVSEQSQQAIIDEMSVANKNVSRLLIPMVMDSTSADIFTAMKWLAPILPIIRVIFGIGAIIISIMLIGSTIVDLCFIGLPIAREGLESRGEGKGKVPFVTSDAVSVIKETESSLDSSGGYKNAYLLYFKRRVLTYIIIAICLLYLVVGELGGLIGWLMGLGDGVVKS